MRIRLVATVAVGVAAILIVGFVLFAKSLNGSQSGSNLPVASAARLGPNATLGNTCRAVDLNLADPGTARVAAISGLRVQWDDVAIMFMNRGPSGKVEIRPQSGTNFVLSPSGIRIALAGRNGILMTLHGADLHSAYSGPTDIWNDGPNLIEVRRVQDFEGVVQLAFGIIGPACYAVTYETYSGGSALHVGIQVTAPLLPAPDPSRLTASGCSGPAPSTPQRRFDNYTLRLAPDWFDTGNNSPTETRAVELEAPDTYTNKPTLLQLHQFPIEVSVSYGPAATAHTIAVEETASRPFMSRNAITSSIAECTIGGERAAVFGFADGGQIGFWAFMVHKDLLHGIRLVGAGGISDQALKDALSMIGSISWAI